MKASKRALLDALRERLAAEPNPERRSKTQGSGVNAQIIRNRLRIGMSPYPDDPKPCGTRSNRKADRNMSLSKEDLDRICHLPIPSKERLCIRPYGHRGEHRADKIVDILLELAEKLKHHEEELDNSEFIDILRDVRNDIAAALAELEEKQ